jgi:hypothetical protein
MTSLRSFSLSSSLMFSFLLILLTASAAAQAEPAGAPVARPAPKKVQVDCESFSKSLDHMNKLIAMQSAEGVADNSAVRKQMQEAIISNYLLRIEINLTLMIQNKCTVPQEPFTPGDYMSNALNCNLETMKGNYKSPSCDLETWTKQPAADPPAK